MKHTLDSNILIGLIQRYPRDIFPNIWHNIEKLAETMLFAFAVLFIMKLHKQMMFSMIGQKSYLDLSVLLQMKNFR